MVFLYFDIVTLLLIVTSSIFSRNVTLLIFRYEIYMPIWVALLKKNAAVELFLVRVRNLQCNMPCREHCQALVVFLPSTRQHPSYGDCLYVKREYYQNCSVLDCVTQSLQSAAHLCEQFLQV